MLGAQSFRLRRFRRERPPFPIEILQSAPRFWRGQMVFARRLLQNDSDLPDAVFLRIRYYVDQVARATSYTGLDAVNFSVNRLRRLRDRVPFAPAGCARCLGFFRFFRSLRPGQGRRERLISVWSAVRIGPGPLPQVKPPQRSPLTGALLCLQSGRSTVPLTVTRDRRACFALSRCGSSALVPSPTQPHALSLSQADGWTAIRVACAPPRRRPLARSAASAGGSAVLPTGRAAHL
jgi:hypothetical protein